MDGISIDGYFMSELGTPSSSVIPISKSREDIIAGLYKRGETVFATNAHAVSSRVPLEDKVEYFRFCNLELPDSGNVQEFLYMTAAFFYYKKGFKLKLFKPDAGILILERNGNLSYATITFSGGRHENEVFLTRVSHNVPKGTLDKITG